VRESTRSSHVCPNGSDSRQLSRPPRPLQAIMPSTTNGSTYHNGLTKDEDRTLPLWQRPVDFLYLLWYFNFLFAVMFTDIHNFTASFLGMEVHELEHQVNMVWPPRFLTDMYFRWARAIDPLLYINPLYWQIMEWINLLGLMPFSICALWGFVRGSNWIRLPAIITSSWTWYSLMICIGCTLYGKDKSPDQVMFLAIYIPYLLFPLCVIWRMWEEKPFSAKTLRNRSLVQRAVDMIVLVGMLVMFYFYFLYIYIFIKKEYFPSPAAASPVVRDL